MKKARLFILYWQLLFLSQISFGQQGNLHLFIVTQNSAGEIGVENDKKSISKLAAQIAKATQLKLNLYLWDSKDVTKESVRNQLNQLAVGSNDVIWYYYSGHGENYDTFPMTDENSIPLSFIHDLIARKGARLTLAMYDCCNWHEPIEKKTKSGIYVSSALSNYVYLFLYSSGNLKTSSSSSTEFSYGSKTGSFYTNSFIEALGTCNSWQKVAQMTTTNTQQTANALKVVQNPQFKFFNFKDTE